MDIYAAVRPRLAIVDGIVGMEGDGPIMGSPCQANLLLMGTNLPAVDATGARLMGFDPRHIPYLGPAEPIRFDKHIVVIEIHERESAASRWPASPSS